MVSSFFNLAAKVLQKMPICKIFVQKLAFRCKNLANGLHEVQAASEGTSVSLNARVQPANEL